MRVTVAPLFLSLSGKFSVGKSIVRAIDPEAAQRAIREDAPKRSSGELGVASKTYGCRHVCWSCKNSAIAVPCDDSAPSGAVDDVCGHGLVLCGVKRGLSVPAKGLVNVTIADAVELGFVRLDSGVVVSDLSIGSINGGGDGRKSLRCETDLAEFGNASRMAGHRLDATVASVIRAVNLCSDDNLALAKGLADALEVKAKIGRDGDFECGSGNGRPVDGVDGAHSVIG